MADSDGYNYALTVYFDDGTEPITERFMREETIERAKKSWHLTQQADLALGVYYNIVRFEVEEL